MDETPSLLRQAFFRSLDEPISLLRLFDFLPHVFMYVKDARGRFVAMNRALVELRGGSEEAELLGRTDLELHPAYWGRRYQEEDRKVLESGKAIPGQVWLVPDADGRLALFVSSKIPLRDRSGTAIGVAGVMHRLNPQEDSERPHRGLESATEIVAQRYGSPLTVAELAHAAGLSTSQLNRRFRATYQMSPSEYLQRVRIHEASRLLSETDATIGEVAQRTGFYDQAHLTRTFRKRMGLSPSEFRRTLGSRPVIR
jgi:PAS domain S-box-containing protein